MTSPAYSSTDISEISLYIWTFCDPDIYTLAQNLLQDSGFISWAFQNTQNLLNSLISSLNSWTSLQPFVASRYLMHLAAWSSSLPSPKYTPQKIYSFHEKSKNNIDK